MHFEENKIKIEFEQKKETQKNLKTQPRRFCNLSAKTGAEFLGSILRDKNVLSGCIIGYFWDFFFRYFIAEHIIICTSRKPDIAVNYMKFLAQNTSNTLLVQNHLLDTCIVLTSKNDNKNIRLFLHFSVMFLLSLPN